VDKLCCCWELRRDALRRLLFGGDKLDEGKVLQELRRLVFESDELGGDELLQDNSLEG